MDFQERIEYMLKIIDSFRWDSCAEILVYLALRGSMSANQLKRHLGMKGEKSIYKPLKALLEGGFIKKKEGDKPEYYLSGQYIHDPEFDKDFLEYLLESGNFEVLSDYFEATNRISRVFLRLTDRLISEKVKSTKDVAIAQKFLEGSVFYENLISIDNPETLGKKIQNLIEKEVAKHVPPPEFWEQKVPLPNPAAIYIAFIPLPE
ncbi:MAG: transcriptional regulator [Methanobacteriota archaeon]|nr:MAG: transcriptional regulator [Euryarchaeota archaeon]